MRRLTLSPVIFFSSLRFQSNMTTARVWLSALACVAAFFCELPAAEGTSYGFTVIAQTGGEFTNVSSPSINNSGVVAFRAFPSVGGEAIYKSDGASLVPMLDTLGNIRTFSRPIISDSGSVVVEAGTGIVGTPGSGSGLFLADGVSVTTLIDTSGPYEGFLTPSINSSDVVVSNARGGGGNSSIIRLDGAAVTTLYDTTGPFTAFGAPQINDAGEVVFLAGLGPGAFDAAIFRGDGGTPSLIADASGPFSGQFSSPDVNNDGKVSFWAELDSGEQGIFIGDGESVTTVVDSTGALPVPASGDLFRYTSINSEGAVAFDVGISGGIYIGPDPLLDKVIVPGDSLFGSTVTSASLQGAGHSLNDRGEIAFWAELANGNHYIVRATPAGAGDVIFDNGPLSGPQVGRNMGSPFTMFEDFTLTESREIIGFRWTQHDADALTREYLGTVLSVYESEVSAGTLLFSDTIVASRRETGDVIQGEPLLEYEYLGLSLSLSPGTYYLGLNDPNSGLSGWVQTTGTAQTMPGRWQGKSPNSLGTFFENENSVFQVLGVVPAPTTFPRFSFLNTEGGPNYAGKIELVASDGSSGRELVMDVDPSLYGFIGDWKGFAADNTYYYFLNTEGGPNYAGRIERVAIDGSTGRELVMDVDPSLYGYIGDWKGFAADKHYFYFLNTEGGPNYAGRIERVAKDGSTGRELVLDVDPSVYGFITDWKGFATDGQFFYFLNTQGGPNYAGRIDQLSMDGSVYNAGILDVEPSLFGSIRDWKGFAATPVF